MYNQQYNAYDNFANSNSINQIIIIYDELIRLISEAKNDINKKEENLEKSLDIAIKLLSSIEEATPDIAKKSLQSFYFLMVKRISKILYCNQNDLYNKLIDDIKLVKSTWEGLNI